MAKSLGMDSQKPGVSTELRDRLLFVVLALLVYRIGSHIPVPGINTVRLDQLMEQQKDTVIGLFNMFSGGALARASVCSWHYALHFLRNYRSASCRYDSVMG